jgi:two-component system cell cycle sensor histidine kinase/response regulator CckA
MPRGSETILLVEDDDAVRALGRHILTGCGYHVLEASDGSKALDTALQYDSEIHLLLSDVVMPHLGGRMLSEAVVALRPQCRVLFLSGYNDDDVLRHGVVESEVEFLQKPYTPALLAQKVRTVLDSDRR